LIEHVQRDFPNLAIVDVFEDSDQAIDLNLSSVALESIIKSLIENAYKHGGEDVSVGLKVTRTEADPERLTIRISDTGPGVDEKYRDSIFEPLFSTKPTRAISGLGLANVRKLLELAGGTVELIDSPSGATFEISLPMF
jgi:signal transduction histidine kinase